MHVDCVRLDHDQQGGTKVEKSRVVLRRLFTFPARDVVHVTGTRVQISVHVPTPTSDVAARKWAKSLTNALKRQNFSASGGRLRRGACCTVNPAWLQEEVRHKPGAHLTMGMARAFKK